MTHTPGPWKIHIVKDGGDWEYQVRTVRPHNPAGTIGIHVATVNSFLEAKGQQNADLLAAAPDLLQSLQDVLSHWYECDSHPTIHDQAKAAIAKAKGEKP